MHFIDLRGGLQPAFGRRHSQELDHFHLDFLQDFVHLFARQDFTPMEITETANKYRTIKVEIQLRM